MRRLFLLTLLLLLSAACRSADGQTGPRLAADWQATPLASRTPIPAATDSPEPEAETIPTLAPTPTWGSDGMEAVPTLAPTPLPPGVYRRESDGFTIFYPSTWIVQDDSDQSFVISDPDLGLVLGIESRVIDEETSYEAYLDFFMSEAFGLVDAELVSEDQIPFAGGSGSAEMAIIGGHDSDGIEFQIRLAFAEQDARGYLFFAYGTPRAIAARETTFQAIVAQVQLGGSLIYGLNRDETLVLLGGDPDPRALDPARTTGSAAGYVGLLYSGLVRLSPELQVVPELAETWQISPDGTEYTFTLRPDLQFADGSPLTADDVRYSLERAADPETESTTARTYLGDILGFDAKLDGDADTIEGIEVVDDRTLIITLDGPKPYFLAKLTYPTSFVMDEESVKDAGDDWLFEPNASGPYILKEYREEEALIFERNPLFHDQPEIANVVYLSNRVGTGISLFESGEIDIVYLDNTETAEVRRPSHALHDQWVSGTSMCTSFVQMNNTLAPLDDVNVRQALALAVDKEAINELLSESLSLRADSILPPAMPGYSLELAQAQAENTFDPEAAQAALAASSYGDDLPPIIVQTGGFANEEDDLANALVAGWQDVLGIEVTVEYLDPELFTAAVRDESAHLVLYGWCADYADPENFLDVLYHTDSEFNVASYSNPELDALMEEARVELDPARRLALYQELESRLLADGAAIPLLHGVSDALVNAKIQGTVVVPIGALTIPFLTLEAAGDGE
jgi:oligopeptide transport system substrate-binding protein